jgi:hypothetical protein
MQRSAPQADDAIPCAFRLGMGSSQMLRTGKSPMRR